MIHLKENIRAVIIKMESENTDVYYQKNTGGNMKQQVILKAAGIYKSFGATKALKNADLMITAGEIHGLIGENGSGKSTLSSIIAGAQPFDEGKMEYKGNAYCPQNIFEAIYHGIAMVGQEQCTFEDMTVAENIFVGKEDRFVKFGIVRTGEMVKEAKIILDRLGLAKILPENRLKKYDFEQRKLIELARALYEEPQLLIIDETSTTLGQSGREVLYKSMFRMKEEKKSVLFISHDIDEIMEICDRVTILRDGDIICTMEKKDYDSHQMKQFMVGREIEENYYRTDYDGRLTDDVALEAQGICTEQIDNISVQLHYGEILGIGGLTDCGMHELGQILFGLKKPLRGTVKTGDGTSIRNSSVALGKKMAYISKNRDKEALMLASTIQENICLPSLKRLRKGLIISRRQEQKFTKEYAGLLQVKMDNINQNVMYLSGGNKQKVAVAKWLGTDADIYIFDCPTRGIDVGVQSDIYDLLEELKKKGKAILMISEELPELIGMSDRILVLKEGKLSAEFPRDQELSESKLIQYII